jgi:hypothetical protein
VHEKNCTKILKGVWFMNPIATAKLHTDNGETYELSYFLRVFDGEKGEKFYGLRIDKSTPEGVLIEREETLAVTESHEEILIMARAFAGGSVPPVTLLEMTDEWQPGELILTA